METETAYAVFLLLLWDNPKDYDALVEARRQKLSLDERSTTWEVEWCNKGPCWKGPRYVSRVTIALPSGLTQPMVTSGIPGTVDMLQFQRGKVELQLRKKMLFVVAACQIPKGSFSGPITDVEFMASVIADRPSWRAQPAAIPEPYWRKLAAIQEKQQQRGTPAHENAPARKVAKPKNDRHDRRQNKPAVSPVMETGVSAIVQLCPVDVSDDIELMKLATMSENGTTPYVVTLDESDLTWNLDERTVAIRARDGAWRTIPFSTTDAAFRMLTGQCGKTRLVWYPGKCYLVATCDIPDDEPANAIEAQGHIRATKRPNSTERRVGGEAPGKVPQSERNRAHEGS